MFKRRQDAIDFIEDLSRKANPPYIRPYLNDDDLDSFENKLGKTLPASFRKWLFLCNFDDLELGGTYFAEGKSNILDSLCELNEEDSGEFLKIAISEMGGIFISTESGEVWSQYIERDIITQNKLADDFEKFMVGLAFMQKNAMEGHLSLEEATLRVAAYAGADDATVWRLSG